MKGIIIIGLCILLIGCSIKTLEPHQSPFEKGLAINNNSYFSYNATQNGEVFRVMGNGEMTFTVITFKCPNYYNYTPLDVETIQESYDYMTNVFSVIGCVFTELYNQSPNLTQEVLDKYNIDVGYESFDIN